MVDHLIEEEQAAFRPSRKTHDYIHFQSQKNLVSVRDLFLALFDLKAAFDSIPRKEIWNALPAKQVPNRLTDIGHQKYVP